MRSISEPEAAVLARMLERCAVGGAGPFDPASLAQLKVVAQCDCGCDSVDFEGIAGSGPPTMIADGQGMTAAGDEVAVMVFGSGTVITSLEVYNYSNRPARLPAAETIRPFGQ